MLLISDGSSDDSDLSSDGRFSGASSVVVVEVVIFVVFFFFIYFFFVDRNPRAFSAQELGNNFFLSKSASSL